MPLAHLETLMMVLLGLGGREQRISEQEGGRPLHSPPARHARSASPDPASEWLRLHAYRATDPRCVEPFK